jgi:hypothetical protein
VTVNVQQRVTQQFRDAAGLELLDALDREEDVVYVLDAELTLHFFNLAWWRNALANGGERCLEDYGLGASARGVVSGVLRRFYDEAFGSVLVGGPPVDHSYSCPTASEHVLYRMRVVRLGPTGRVDPAAGQTAFLVVSNQLVHAKPAHDDTGTGANVYVGREGLVVMCAHCRRCRRPASPGSADTVWDWVPAYVASPPGAVSHGLCPTCFAHHYPG